MSYARSPRALCSTTIGTRCPMCALRDLVGRAFSFRGRFGGRRRRDALRLLDEAVDRLRADDPVEQRADVGLQRLDDALARLAVLGGERVELGLDVGLRSPGCLPSWRSPRPAGSSSPGARLPRGTPRAARPRSCRCARGSRPTSCRRARRTAATRRAGSRSRGSTRTSGSGKSFAATILSSSSPDIRRRALRLTVSSSRRWTSVRSASSESARETRLANSSSSSGSSGSLTSCDGDREDRVLAGEVGVAVRVGEGGRDLLGLAGAHADDARRRSPG